MRRSRARSGRVLDILGPFSVLLDRSATARRPHKKDRVTQPNETLIVRQEGAALFAEIAAPLESSGPEMVRDLVSLIQRAEADDGVQVLVFTSTDPDYFISHVDVTRIGEYREEAAKLAGEASLALLSRHLSASRLAPAETSVAIPISSARAYATPRRSRIGAAMTCGFQIRDGEPALARMLGDLADH